MTDLDVTTSPIPPPSEAHGDAWQHLLRSLLPRPPGTVLDLVEGVDLFGAFAASNGLWVTGLIAPSESPEQPRRRARRGSTRRFVLGRHEAPPFDDMTFDAILAPSRLHEVVDSPEVLGNWLRLLRGSGRLLLVDVPDAASEQVDASVRVMTLRGFVDLVLPGLGEALRTAPIGPVPRLRGSPQP